MGHKFLPLVGTLLAVLLEHFIFNSVSAHALTSLNTGQVLLHTCQVITPDNNIATVFNILYWLLALEKLDMIIIISAE